MNTQPTPEWEERFSKIAQEVEDEFGMAGLTGGLYEDFAYQICKKILSQERKTLLEGIVEELKSCKLQGEDSYTIITNLSVDRCKTAVESIYKTL